MVRIKAHGTGCKHKKIIQKKVFLLPDDLEPFVPYTPNYKLDENEWFGINNFSEKTYCLDILKTDFSSVEYASLDTIETNKLDYLWAHQDEGEYFFQRISKTQLLRKNVIFIKNAIKFEENTKIITVNTFPDAIYLKEKDILYFKKLSSITSIFKGIGDLYRAATDAEVTAFLEQEFIQLNPKYSTVNVRQHQRRRIALVKDTLESYSKNQKKQIFQLIEDYCPDLACGNNKFKIDSGEDLNRLLYGIEQRFYTTIVGEEKRLANSVITI